MARKRKERYWAKMYSIYYHDIPKSISQWSREFVPTKRCGRIAYLKEDKLFSYVTYHDALVKEGLLKGDKYQSIALHEDILFSYFEEPRQSINIKMDNVHESEVIKQWIAADPESHFIPLPEGGGENFTLLPEHFAMGIEDERECEW